MAVSQLPVSRLATPEQMELVGGDVDLADFKLQMHNLGGIQLVSAITSATVSRTVEGASSLTIELDDDPQRTIQLSGKLGRKVDVNVNGLWWRLVGVKKTGRKVTLTFEEREVNLLRYYNSFIMADRSKTTRAQFILRMIQEVKEAQLRYVIPELNVEQPISDATQPGQVEVGSTGQPITNIPDASSGVLRASSIPNTVLIPTGLTVKGVPATAEQIGNANTILGVGVSKRASTKVLVCSIMTAIDESSIINLPGGDLDSVGVFQQRASQGWPASRNVALDAAAFFDAAIPIDKANPSISYNDLCQNVQHSGTPYAYGQYQGEAEAFVKAYGISSTPTGSGSGDASNNQAPSDNPSAALSGNFYTRGTLSQKATHFILTKEDSWTCIQRLVGDVNWRAFVVSGTIYVISERYLFNSKPFMSISEDTPGIDWIDYEYDEGKRNAEITVQAHFKRWSAPPGSIVLIRNMGIIDGKWIVNTVERDLYQTVGDITLKKPLPVLPEPTQLTSIPTGFSGPPSASTSGTPTAAQTAIQQKIVNYAKSQLGVPYVWAAEEKGIAFDCSGLTQAAYSYAGISIPHNAQAQYDQGPVLSLVDVLEPGDLVFFGSDTGHIEHVGIFIGGSSMIDAPHTGAVVRVDDNFKNWTNPNYVGATRAWQVNK